MVRVQRQCCFRRNIAWRVEGKGETNVTLLTTFEEHGGPTVWKQERSGIRRNVAIETTAVRNDRSRDETTATAIPTDVT